MVLTETKVDESFIATMKEHLKHTPGKGLLEECSESIPKFAYYMCGIKTIRAWQIYVLLKVQKMLEDDDQKGLTKILAVLTSRQIGKTTMDALISDWIVIFNKRPKGLGHHSPIGLISASDDQAKKLMKEMRKILTLADTYMERTYKDGDGKPLFGKKVLKNLIDDKEENNTDTITFKVYDKEKHGEYFLKDSLIGSFIKSYPPTAVILGNTFTFVIVDEAGKTDRIKDEVFKDYIRPTTDEYQAPILLTSTAWDPSGYFYETCDVDGKINNPNVESMMFTIDAIKIEAPERYASTMRDIEGMNKAGDTATVQRQYYCRFVKSEKVYFDPEKINECFDPSMAQLEEFKGPCDMGIDFGGKSVSKSAITITYYNEDTGEIIRIYKKKYPLNQDESLFDDAKELQTRFNIQRIIPDDCPAGWYVIKQMIAAGWPVYPMNFKTDKVKKYGAFRARLNLGKVKSFVDDDLQVEMRVMENTQGGKQSYIMAAPGYTDDLIDSFVMSCYFFLEEDNRPSFHYWDNKEDTNE